MLNVIFFQVVYVTATAPYIFLTIMFIRGLTLDGAVDGIVYYVTPDFEKLLHHEVILRLYIFLFLSQNMLRLLKRTVLMELFF